MCTLSWLQRPGGYAVVASRDERRTRGRARPPRRVEAPGGAYLAPADADAGGTWIAANAHGLTVVLLNARLTAGEDPARVYASRGTLVSDLADAAEVGELEARLSAWPLGDLRGFVLVAFGADGAARRWSWRGQDLEGGGAPVLPVLSEPIDDREIGRVRRGAFAEAPTERLDQLLDLHRSHAPVRGPHSVCMHAEEASTVSLSVVEVRDGRVDFRYADGPPCTAALGEAVTLERRR